MIVDNTDQKTDNTDQSNQDKSIHIKVNNAKQSNQELNIYQHKSTKRKRGEGKGGEPKERCKNPSYKRIKKKRSRGQRSIKVWNKCYNLQANEG